MPGLLTVTFYGVRGSTPCADERTRDFGGNTACVLIEAPGSEPIICDMGTGLPYLGTDLIDRGDVDTDQFRATMLVSHLHWDHIQGLPFFRPLLQPGSEVDIFGPPQDDGTLAEAFAQCIKPPVFPVSLEDLPGTIRYRDLGPETIRVGSAAVTAFPVRHVGPTNGYRIDNGTGSVVFICDHQQPHDGSLEVPADVVAACAGADVLIHDSQYDAEEFALKNTWGHCTPDFALELAKQAGVRRLVMFHHDPSHSDEWIREQRCRLQAIAGDEV
ncbi:MAG: MBL fold metallo-hydrolase, partial [Actinomycetota bacterium]